MRLSFVLGLSALVWTAALCIAPAPASAEFIQTLTCPNAVAVFKAGSKASESACKEWRFTARQRATPLESCKEACGKPAVEARVSKLLQAGRWERTGVCQSCNGQAVFELKFCSACG